MMIFIYHRLGDKDYLVYYDYLFSFLCVVWGYGYIILVILDFLDHCYLYHRTGIYFIL